MGLGDLEKPAELWSVVKNKEGKEFPGILKCNSIKQLEEEEPELAGKLNDVFQKWYSETGKEAAEKLLTTFGKDGGYSYKHTDGNTYKFGKFNGQLTLTKLTGQGWGGKGKTFTFMRTDMVLLGKIDVVEKVIGGQGPNESWKISHVAGDTIANAIFLLERQSVYTPASTTKEKDKEKEQEDSE